MEKDLDQIVSDEEFQSMLGISKEQFLKLNVDGRRTLLTNKRNQYSQTLDMGDSVNSGINDKITKIESIQKKIQESYEYGGSKKVTFVKDGKKNTRKVQVNKRGTKFVRFGGKDIPVSRLKLV